MQGSKRPRSGITESYSQAGGAINANMHDPYKSDYGSMEVSNSAITGLGNDQIGWDWDDDDRGGGGMDIQALLSEFGDFGDFFENDVLPFGEVTLFSFWFIFFSWVHGEVTLILREKEE